MNALSGEVLAGDGEGRGAFAEMFDVTIRRGQGGGIVGCLGDLAAVDFRSPRVSEWPALN